MLITARRAMKSSFFFQAEDGIRDLTVTGVQTCALPISPQQSLRRLRRRRREAAGATSAGVMTSTWLNLRSEEHTSELQSQSNLVCRLLLEKKKHLQTGCVSPSGSPSSPALSEVTIAMAV